MRSPPHPDVVGSDEGGPQLPTGTVTFLFTDIEGSTRLLHRLGTGYGEVLEAHRALLRAAFRRWHGVEMGTDGDSFAVAFAGAAPAIAAAVEAQQALSAHSWPDGGAVRVRIGLHTGDVELSPDGRNYVGVALHVTARISAAGHGGQILVSDATRHLVPDVDAVDLGAHRLKDLPEDVRVFQVTVGGRPVKFPPLRTAGRLLTNLPLQLTSFVGREEDRRNLLAALKRSRLVTVTGVGGVGKTRLALHVATESQPDFGSGVWWCALAGAADEEAMIGVVAESIGMPRRAGSAAIADVVAFLGSRPLLVVLDNCEHLLEAAGLLAAGILLGCPRVSIVATSREALGVEGEQVWPLRPLPLPAPGAGFQMVAASPSIRLFADRARAARPEFELSGGNAAMVASVCQQLDGIPLAIELAAARAAAFSIQDISRLLEDRFRLLSSGRRMTMARHQTLRAAIEWSYSLLDDRERAVFDSAGVFVGGFDLDAAVAVCGGELPDRWDVLDALASLVSKSMIVVDDSGSGGARYGLLETLRQFAIERLRYRDCLDEARRRHAGHYTHLAVAIGPSLMGPEELLWRRRLRDEVGNVGAAVAWSLDPRGEGDGSSAVQIVAALAIGGIQEAESSVATWAHLTVEPARRSAPGLRMAVLCAAAWNCFLSERPDPALGRAMALEAFAGGVPDDCPAPGMALTALAVAHNASGEKERAKEILVDGRRHLLEMDAPASELSLVYQGVGFVLGLAGDDGAAAAAREAVRLARVAGNPSLLAGALSILGRVAWRDDPDGALGWLDEAVGLTRAGASGWNHGFTLGLRAWLRARAGYRAGALTDLRDAVAYSRDKGDWAMVATAIHYGVRAVADVGEAGLAVRSAGIVHVGALARRTVVVRVDRADQRGTLERLRSEMGQDHYDRELTAWADLPPREAIERFLGAVSQLLDSVSPSGDNRTKFGSESPTRGAREPGDHGVEHGGQLSGG